jgi:flagellar hook-basal body complex protein FliE
MSIESIAAIGAGAAALTTPEIASVTEIAPMPAIANAPPSQGAFQSMLAAIGELNQELQTGEQGLQKLAAGGGMDNLHQSLMGMERTRLTMQLLLQVRSRALDAYQELTRMQI